MLTAYFDASGSDHDQPVLTVAGFLSSVENWIKFEKEWSEFLGQWCLPWFHMTEFESAKGIYSQWKNPSDRAKFIDAAINIISRSTYRSFAVTVKTEQPRSEFILKEWFGNAYASGARACLGLITQWMRSQKWNTKIEFILASGDLGKGYLMEMMKLHGYPDPIFRPAKDVSPLQAADLLAWEVFNYSSGKYRGNYERSSHKRLETMPHEWGIHDLESLTQIRRIITNVPFPDFTPLRKYQKAKQPKAKKNDDTDKGMDS